MKQVCFAKNLTENLKSRFPVFMMLATLCDQMFKPTFCINSFEQTRAVGLLTAEVSVRLHGLSFRALSKAAPTFSKTPTSHDCTKENLQTVWETVELLEMQKSQCNNLTPYVRRSRST